MEIVTVNNGYKLFFRYTPIMIKKIKYTFPSGSRRYNPGDKSWLINADQKEVLEEFARKNRFRWASGKKDPEKVYDIPPMPKLELDIPIQGKLRHYQEQGVAYNLERKRVIIGDDMGCIAGHAVINVNISGASKKMTLEKLYKRYSKSTVKDKYKVRCLKDGIFGLHPIKNILDKGIQMTYKIKTKSGKELNCTLDHQILTPNGYKECRLLKKGDKIIINGQTNCKNCGSTENIITYKYSKFLGYCKKCMYKKKKQGRYKTGKLIDKDDYVRLSGYQGHPRLFNGGTVFEHIIVMEKHLGYPIPKKMDVHHKNHNPSDNRIENLELITVSEHHRKHKRFKNFGLYVKPKEDEITQVYPDRLLNVYDIVMENPYRNFVANGIVVHNCGKTLQAIATILGIDKLYNEGKAEPAFPCLVICPSSVKYNWQLQWEKWTGRRYAMILENSIKNNYQLYVDANMAKVFIVNYESLKKYFVKSIEKGDAKYLRLNHIKFDERINIFKSVIIDECHKVKDTKTQQSKFTKGITNGKNYIFGLTGTPVINKPKDLISQLSIIGQLQKFGGYTSYVDRYCSGPKEASNLKELNYLLNKTCFYRRSKQEVAKELPPKTRQVIVSEISTLKEYKDAEKDLVTYLRNYKDASDDKIQSAIRGQVMVQIGVLKNISARGKIKSVIDFVNDTIEQGEKIVLFVHLREVAAMLKEKYKHAATILGSDKLEERQASIKRFQEDKKCNVMIASLKAAGTGVDGLQNSSCMVAFVELGWTAADHDQAEDRLNRIGQTRSVNCFYFLGKNTIDTHIYKIIQTKRGIADIITGNEDEVKTDFVSDFANLFNQK